MPYNTHWLDKKKKGILWWGLGNNCYSFIFPSLLNRLFFKRFIFIFYHFLYFLFERQIYKEKFFHLLVYSQMAATAGVEPV